MDIVENFDYNISTYLIKMEVILIKYYKTLYIGALLSSIATMAYTIKKKKEYNIERNIKIKINNAKMNFNSNEIYGHWIMKKSNHWIGAINIKKGTQIINYPFIIDDKYKLFWKED